MCQAAQQNGSAPSGGYLGDESSGDKITFRPSGIEGATAPSGYSAGESADHAAAVITRASSFDAELRLPVEPILPCNQEKDLIQAAQLHPESVAANHELGMFYVQHGEIGQGIEFLKGAYALQPSDAGNARWLTLAYVSTRQFSQAAELMQAQRHQSPANATPLLWLARIHALMPDRPKAVADYLTAASLDQGQENLFASGIGLVSLGAAPEAQRILNEATGLHPSSARLWMALGVAQDLNDHKADSAGSLLRAADLDPAYLPTFLFLSGLSGVSTSIDAEILRRLKALVAAHPESAEAQYDYALALWQHAKTVPSERRTALIESRLKVAIVRDPAFAAPHFKLGALYQETGDYAQARRELELDLKLDPGNAAAHYRLALVYGRAHQTARAEREMAIYRQMHDGAFEDDDATAVGLHVYARRLSSALIGSSCH